MRRVLIISPHFPPVNAPDHQRVRMALNYFNNFGWDAHVLSVDPAHVFAPKDPLLEATLPANISLTRVSLLCKKLRTKLGFHTTGIPSLMPLYLAGRKLLKEGAFDLIYFSTTQFIVIALALPWQKEFKLPFVVDLQDPWLSNYFDRKGKSVAIKGRGDLTGEALVVPPGGNFKYKLSQLQAKFFERRVLKRAAAVTSVSPAYPETLKERYPELNDTPFKVLPFGAPEADFKLLERQSISQPVFDPKDGLKHWVYVGRGGSDLKLGLEVLFNSIKVGREKDPAKWQNIRLHFVGTSYAAKERAQKSIEPVAKKFGVADIVDEQTERIPYFNALKLLTDSDAVLIIGSDDEEYSPSKLFPALLSGRPILGILHEKSLAADIIWNCNAGAVATFSTKVVDAVAPHLEALIDWPKDKAVELDEQAFRSYTAEAMTEELCDLFNKAHLEGKR